MVLWDSWLTAIGHVLALFAHETRLGMGMSIILLTLVVRFALLPVTWAGAYRAEERRRKLRRLEPALQALKRRYEADRERYAQEVMRLYRREGITIVDGASLLGALIQLPVLLGIYQALRALRGAGRFLWVPDLSRPDFWLAMLAGAATMALMATNPQLPEHVRLILILLPAIFTVIAALKLSAALSIYWTTTNVFSGLQAIALRAVIARRARGGRGG